MEEQIKRRFWVSVQLSEDAGPNQAKFLKYLGFEQIGERTFLKKTRDLELLSAMVKQMSKNAFCFLCTTQPQCLECESWLPFRVTECLQCGSTHIEPRGQVVFNEQFEPQVIFKRRPRPTPATG